MDVREKKPDNVTKKPVRSDLAIENEQSGDSKEKIFFSFVMRAETEAYGFSLRWKQKAYGTCRSKNQESSLTEVLQEN